LSALTRSSPAVLIIIVLSYLLLYSYQFDSNLFAQVDGYYSNNLGLVKILVDKAIQTFQNNSTKDTITHLREAYTELMVSAMNNNIKNKPASLDALAFILGHTIKLLSENNTTTLPKNSSILYLNTLEEQLGQYLPAISSNIENSINRTASTTFPKEPFLEYKNEPYGLKVQYPHNWIIRINNNYSLPSTSSYAHPQVIGSFYLPNSTEGLPFFYIGINSNLSKQFKQFPFTLQQYLNKSLQSKKNSSAFPDFKLIEATAANQNNNNNNSLAGFPAYRIIWTYEHPTYGMRKLMEFGTVVHGSKGYFVDYAASLDKFSKYLPIFQSMKNSFKISISNTWSNKTTTIR
jgi:hypothetical protein